VCVCASVCACVCVRVRVCVRVHERACKCIEHIELPAKLLDYFLRSNKSNINHVYVCTCTLSFMVTGCFQVLECALRECAIQNLARFPVEIGS